MMNNNKLTGILPDSLGNLLKINKIFLGGNMITGHIPSSLGRLTTLGNLDLQDNQFIGLVPASLGNLSLMGLSLSRNKLVGPLPPQIAQIQGLNYLDLSYNPLELGQIPNWLAKINLFSLRLVNTRIKGNLPQWLSSSSIGTLDLSCNELKGTLPTWLGNMSILWSLNLSNNGFYSTIPNEFKNLSLQSVDLHSNNFSGPLEFLFDLPRAKYYYLDVSGNAFTGPIDKDIGSKLAMEPITSLILSNNPLGGRIPESIGNLTRLQVLELAENQILGTIPKKVLNLEKLEEFDVSRNRLYGEIPPHKANIPTSSFLGNSDLCGTPLPPCKHL
ncbi:LRR receptor-like serine/threonine-protein kinase SIK1 [Beta vulgaris subsp. vulgaris]|uniref:LRR receptor-like serine/threonine-protein kinase SIK1 n=1 Tax=Beta vulgaris subsp. vulgaris TaxID=3555 RepID=UPI002036D7E3|nr:LRR receptor-like serine/threonine-protein kinase SIK1 [Beta vulgaris subsp. vulgaris]